MSVVFDRSKFKGAKLSANKDIQKEAQANNKSFRSDNGGRLGFLEIEEGRNVFRILPPHPDDSMQVAYLPKRTSMLKCEVPIYKDGEDTGKTEIKSKNIFIATQHGGLPKDPIELYIEYVRKRAMDEYKDNKDERSKFLSPITGWRDKKGTWNWGINPKTSFVAYAVKNGEIGRLELYEQMISDINKLTINESPDEVMDVDPFSDPDEGFELIITKQKAVDKQGKETGKFEYIISKGEPSRAKREGYPEYFERTKVTDEQLNQLLQQEPLSKFMGNRVYTSRDWDLAIDGLRRFDEEYKFYIFENEEFLDEIEDLSKLVPEYKKDDKDIDKAFEVGKQKMEAKREPNNVKEEDTEEEISAEEMISTIKRVVKKKFGAEYLDQVPKSLKDIQKWYQLIEEGEKLPVVVDDEEPELKQERKQEEKQDDKPIGQKNEDEKSTVSEVGAVDEDALNERIRNLRNRNRQN